MTSDSSKTGYGTKLVKKRRSLNVQIWFIRYGSKLVKKRRSLHVQIWLIMYGTKLVKKKRPLDVQNRSRTIWSKKDVIWT